MAQHISARVPWKDNGYTGCVCDKTCYNNACLHLKNIADIRDDSFEDSLHGCPILAHEGVRKMGGVYAALYTPKLQKT